MKVIIFALTLLMAGCSSGPNNAYLNAPGATETEALVYLYRTKGHSMLNATYTIGDTKVVSLDNMEFSYLLVPEGEFRYSVAEPLSRPLSLNVNFEAGNTYYIKYGIETKDGKSYLLTKMVSEEEALKALPYSEYKRIARPIAKK